MDKQRIKIGYLPLYIKLYDDSDPSYRDPMVKYMHTLVSMLESQGLEVILAGVCRIEEEFKEAVELFNSNDVAAVVTQHLAYSPSLEAIDALCSIEAPIIILDTTPDYELMSRADYYDGIFLNHGIHGVQDMCNLLKQRGVNYEIRAGHAMHSDVIAQVAGLCRAAAVAREFKNARIGSVGGAFEGMGDFFVTDEHLKKSIGADVFYMDESAIRESLDSVTDKDIDDEIAWDKAHFNYEIVHEENYRLSIKAGLAIRNWMGKKDLTACTVNFLTLDKSGLPKMPFAECSKMLARGTGYAGEGDVLTAGLVGALRKVYPGTTFSEMFCPDWKEDVILLSHMGECNLNLAAWRPVLKDTPFNYNACGDTAAAYFGMRSGSAVFVNLAPMNEGYTLIVTPVEMLDNRGEFSVYRDSIHGWLKPVKPLAAFLPEFSYAGGTHHSALVYDVDYHEIAAFGHMMGFDIVVID